MPTEEEMDALQLHPLRQHGDTHKKEGSDPILDRTDALSQLTIDADKDWDGKNITNFSSKGYNVGNQLVHGITFNLGLAAVGTKLAQALIQGTFSISKVKIYADTAPTGASLIVDVNKNGTTIFTTQANRPEIAIDGHADDSGTPDVTALAEGDRLSVDIDQVGSVIPGGDDLLVTVIM